MGDIGGIPLPEQTAGRYSRLVDARLRKHLREIARCYSYLCRVVRAFGRPGPATDSFAERAAAGDRTLLHDCLCRVSLRLDAIASSLEADIEPTATDAAPGSAKKVDVLAERFASGKKLFSDADS